MEKYVIDQIRYGLKYLPKCLVRSYFEPASSTQTEAFRKKAGGFICGVCHPNENYAQLKRGNIEWIRIDIPFPYDKNGSVRKSYEDFKDRCKGYKDRGFKVMAVTPYPCDYIEAGVDPREDEQGVREIAVFLLNDVYQPFYKWRFRAMRALPRLALDAELLEYLITTHNDGQLADDKYEVMEGIAADLIGELVVQGLTKADCGDLGKHAYSVNDGISDGSIRTMNILAGV